MPEAPIETVPAALPAGPEDTVVFALTHLPPPRRGRQHAESLYVVVHRRYGTWTHVYAIGTERPRNRTEVRLLKVLAGDRLAEALSLAEHLARRPPPRTNDAPFHESLPTAGTIDDERPRER
jgi:hypothetical protein